MKFSKKKGYIQSCFFSVTCFSHILAEANEMLIMIKHQIKCEILRA